MDFDLGPPAARPASPIADLSYRGYDGPLSTRLFRWWIVALAGIRLNLKKPWFWVLAGLCLFPYLFQGITLLSNADRTLQALMGGNAPEARYTQAFFNAFSGQQFLLFITALLVGASSIAADNRANALLVYLSRPITKNDYLAGKWVGVFLPVFVVAFFPALLLYLFCLVSYTSEGFWRDDPWLLGRIVLACAIAGAIHASLLLGCSSWSKTPRMAGAIYAALYLVSGIVAGIAGSITTVFSGSSEEAAREILVTHLSIGGVITGLAQNVYHLTLQSMRFNRRAMQPVHLELAPPAFWVMLGLGLAMVVVGLAATRMRIRAVEVVRG
ncbi:MAG TPA: ABC transporter permease subunit [Chthonomonadaceae bacterium]|nr:ABC transporter permease subunit [Chthonomonadaceae bacterium]